MLVITLLLIGLVIILTLLSVYLYIKFNFNNGVCPNCGKTLECTDNSNKLLKYVCINDNYTCYKYKTKRR